MRSRPRLTRRLVSSPRATTATRSPRPGRSSDGAEGVSFNDVASLIHAAVEQVAATDAHPTDPFRGLYVSDDLALTLARSARQMPVDAALGDAARKLDLDELDAALLALCLAPELDPRYGRLLGYLHDDLTRKLLSPRLAARLLSAAGYESRDVLARFARDRPLRQTGAIRLLEGDEAVPLAERLLKVAEPLACHVLGARLEPTSPTTRGVSSRRQTASGAIGRCWSFAGCWRKPTTAQCWFAVPTASTCLRRPSRRR